MEVIVHRAGANGFVDGQRGVAMLGAQLLIFLHHAAGNDVAGAGGNVGEQNIARWVDVMIRNFFIGKTVLTTRRWAVALAIATAACQWQEKPTGRE